MLSSPKSQRWFRIACQFLAGQASIQGINLVVGFCLLRWMAKQDYAQFSLAFAFQTTLNSLVDLGFAGSIVALVGSRGGNKQEVGRYVKAAQSLRLQMLLFGVLGTVVAFPYMAIRQGWSPMLIVLMTIGVLGAVAAQSLNVYGAPLLINQQLPKYYRPQILSSTFRLLTASACHFGGVLSAWVLSWLSAISIAITGFSYRKAAREFIEEPPRADSEQRREIVKYIGPLMPGLVFTALQGQLTIALISWFGNTASIAEVAALGRLGQFFMVLSAFNGTILEPYMARLPYVNLRRRYFQIWAGAAVFAGGLTMLSFLFPAPLIWILGPKYQQLGNIVGWSIASASVSFVASLVWTMNSGRAWIFWWYTAAHIAVLCVVQIFAVFFLNLSTTVGVMQFAVISSAAAMVTHLVAGCIGMKQKPRHEGHEPHRPSVPAMEELDQVAAETA